MCKRPTRPLRPATNSAAAAPGRGRRRASGCEETLTTANPGRAARARRTGRRRDAADVILGMSAFLEGGGEILCQLAVEKPVPTVALPDRNPFAEAVTEEGQGQGRQHHRAVGGGRGLKPTPKPCDPNGWVPR